MPLHIPKPTRFIQAGYKPVEGGFDKKEEEKQETSRERAARHRQERREELRYTASDEQRWARNRERVISERKKIEVPSFELDDALKNPELDGVKPLNIDPVSMVVETVVDLIDGAKEFVSNPSLGGVAAMAAIAIPGKVAEKVITRLPRSNGQWVGGFPGDGLWKSELDEVNQVTGGKPIPFKSGKPDFSEWSKGKVTFKNGELDGTDKDFSKVYNRLKISKGLTSQSKAKRLLKEKGLTPHHVSSTEIMLVPTQLHGNIPHVGSASEMRRLK
jgi:hypothetical protein